MRWTLPLALLLLLLLHVCHGKLTIVTPNLGDAKAPRYTVSKESFSIVNASVTHVKDGMICDDAIPQAGNNSVLFVAIPLCYPEDLAAKAADKGYQGLIIGNGIAPATGLWAVSLWKSKKQSSIAVVDVHVTLVGSKPYKQIEVVSLDSTSENYFTQYANSAGFIFLLVLAFISTLIQMYLSLQRMRFQWIHGGARHQKPGVKSQTIAKLSNIATLITVFHFLGALFRLILLIDPFGVYGNYNFLATNWLVFFCTTCSEVATFLLGFSLHRIIAQLEEEFHGGNVRHELNMMIFASSGVAVLNLSMTLLNNIVGLPDSFFLVLNLYGLGQIYIFWYFFQNRAKVLQQENNTASATGSKKGTHREYQMRRSMQLLQAGLLVITLYVIVLQPISLAVLKLGMCKSGKGDCSSLLAILVLMVILMNTSAILQLKSLPGETKQQWQERMGDRVIKSDDAATGGATNYGQSSQVVELEDADMNPSVAQSATAQTQHTHTRHDTQTKNQAENI